MERWQVMWLRRSETGDFREDVCLETSPCPTIMAGGIGGGNCSQYRLEDDGIPPVTVVAPRKRFSRSTPVDKPPYRVPSMAEIKAIPANGFKVVSTFSGCGGSCLGYRMAGFSVVWANEFIPAAQDSYRANHASTILDCRDIRTITADEINAATGMKTGEIDLLDGSPPCASFSMAGKREASWGKVKQYSDTKQRVDDLFTEYARLLKDLQPKTFVAENVSGLVKGVAKGYFIDILQLLKSCGYRVRSRVLDAQWLGVPQMRQRLIFVGVREDLKPDPVHPTPLPYRYSVKDALPWIVSVERIGPQFTPAMSPATEPSGAISAQGNWSFKQSPFALVEAETDISRYSIGEDYDALKAGESVFMGGRLHKPSVSKPCPTVVQTGGVSSAAAVCHPTEKRKFSIAELKRICAFPDDFILTGTYAQQWERLGRSVPPVMMAHIATAVRDQILCRL